MAGLFEVFVDAESHFRFRLTAPCGTVMAVSKAFNDKPAAVAGIAAVPECARGIPRPSGLAGGKAVPAVTRPPRVCLSAVLGGMLVAWQN